MRQLLSNWLFWAVLFTLCYLAALGFWLIPATELCEDGAKGYFERLLSCRKANELGDLLAGVFAPVAFVWLMAAVFIQAQELRAQREELSLTRLELAESRKVMEEQARQAQRQADFIGEQTNNLKNEADLISRQRKDAVFDAALTSFHLDSLGQLSNRQYSVPTSESINLGRFADLRRTPAEAAIREFNNTLNHLLVALRRPKGDYRNLEIPIEQIRLTIDPLARLTELSDGLSAAHQIKFDGLRIRDSLNVSRLISEAVGTVVQP